MSGKLCSVEVCGRPMLAKDLCNGHYLRSKNGGSMTTAINRVEKGRTCSKCDEKHFGNDFCRSHYAKNRRSERLERLVELLGGKCSMCKEKYPLEVYDFHHLEKSKKLFGIGQKIADLEWVTIEKEAMKCELLCANCHRIKEFGV